MLMDTKRNTIMFESFATAIRCDTSPFENFTKRVIQTWNESDQLYFLKVFPIFNSRLRLISIWIDTYKSYIVQRNRIDFKQQNDLSVYKRESIINFLITGLTYEYLETNMNDIGEILILMKNAEEDAGCINSVKFNFTKFGIDNKVLLNRSKSAKLLNELMYKKMVTTNSTLNTTPLIIKDIILFSAKEFAYELTRVQSGLFSKTNIHEIINFAMNDKCDPALCPNVTKLMTNFKKLSFYVQLEIVKKRTTIDTQTAFIKAIINIALVCKEINNFHSLFAIVSSLVSGPVREKRFKELWNPKHKYMKVLQELENFICPTPNFKNYRECIRSSGKKATIPYIGLLLGDIKRLSEHELYIEKVNNIDYEVYNGLLHIIKSYESLNMGFVIPINKQVFIFFDRIQYRENEEIQDDQTKNLLVRKKSIPGLFNSSQSIITSSKKSNLPHISETSSEEKLSKQKICEDKKSYNELNDSKQSIKHDKRLLKMNHGEKQSIKLEKITEKNEETNKEMLSKRDNIIEASICSNRKYDTFSKQKRSRSNFEKLSIDLTFIDPQLEKDLKAPRSKSPREIKILKDPTQSTTPRESKTPRTPKKSRSLNDTSPFDIVEIDKWECFHVTQWLTHIGMPEYTDIFRANEINGFSIVELNETHLKEVGITKLGHRITIIKRIQHLKSIS